MRVRLALLLLLAIGAGLAHAQAPLTQPPNTWVKRSPLANTPVSPMLGYEGACAWDSRHDVLIRYGGHNQGGGGEQNAEVWTFDPLTAKWTLKEPNTSPPGICCGQQNVFDPVQGRYIRFPAFSGSHGWQWFREIYMNDSSAWSYDLTENTWRNMRPVPQPSIRPLRCASWDSRHQVILLFGGEGSRDGTLVYDPYTNEWTRMRPTAQPAFRSGGNLAYDAERRVHVLFGAQFDDDAHTWTYDLRANAWRDMQPPSMPPTDRNDAVLTYDPHNKVVLAVVKVSEGEEDNARSRLETWAYDAGANRWRKMSPPQEPDASGNRARVLSFAPELGLALLENRTHPPRGEHEQQIWTYRYAEAPADPAPAPPTALRIRTTAGGARLTWRASASAGVTGYAIFRGTGAHTWEAGSERIATVEAGRRAFDDGTVIRGARYFYTVRALAGERESADSEIARAQPRVVEDAVVSVISPRRVELAWQPPSEGDIAGYHVERARVEVYTEDQLVRLKSNTPPLAAPSVGAIRRIGAFQRLTEAPLRQASFTDTSVDLSAPRPVEGEPLLDRSFADSQRDDAGQPYRFAVYAYRLRAVNALGVESGPSPAFYTIPAAPQWLFAREDGDVAHLKWQANAEQGLRGYRVYRMDGRYNNEPIPRLTPEPIAALGFTDPAAGDPTRRYYVVAVDALGQEGFPSAPVWHKREWQRYYLPFIGEWRQ